MSSDRGAPLIDGPPGRTNAFHVDLDALDHNVNEIRRMVGPEVLIFAALKANAYGFGVVEIAHAVLKSGADGLAVVDLREAVLLRNAGIDAPIYLFGGMLISAEVARYISDFDLMPTILRIEDATAVSQAATKSIRVFIKVEVGVERFGIAVADVQAFAKIVRSMPNIELYGLSTHLHVPRRDASEVAPYLQRQFQRFEDAVRQVESDGELVPVKMAASSGSLSMTGTMNLNAVDPGHLLFGLRPGGPDVERLDIRPVMASLKSELVHIHVVQRTEDMDLAPFPVRRGMRIGVLPIGVVDGMLSLHSGSVLVNGCRCPVLDVSLEHTRIDLTGANALVGDEIVIIGRQGEDTIDVTDVLAHHKLRIPASVPLAVHHTVPRVYIRDNGAEVALSERRARMTADVQLATRGTTSPKTGSRPLLEVKNLSTQFFTQDGIVRAVDDVSFYVMPGETLGVVGESGCGKSVTGLSIMRLIPSPPGKIVQGEIVFNGNDILQMSDDDIRKIRGHEIAMIFQDPMTSLNPVLTINRQLSEVLQLHLGMNQAQAKTQSIELLKIVGIPNPEERIDQYPHQFSGGMRQRVMIAMALSCNPKLIIADEPTTALDVTVQAQILDLMRTLQSERDTGVILITHSMGVVAGMADRVQVMYAGHIVEAAETEEIFGNPRHPYTVGLMKSIPGLDSAQKEKLEPIRGLPPDLIDLPDMCPFLPRCNFAREQCEQKRPPLLQVAQGHFSACWFWEEVSKESYASIAVGMQDRAEAPVASQGGVS